MMKKVVLVLLFCTAALTDSYSQTKQASIKELFHLMQKDSVIDRTLTSMMPTIIKLTQKGDSTLSESDRNSLNSKLQMAKDLTAKMQTDEMALYDKYYSLNEILDLIAFFKTQSGRRYIELNKKIQNDLSLIVKQKYMHEIMQMVIENKLR